VIRWNVVALVARREIVERAQTRAFLISTAILLIVVAGLTVLSTRGGGETTTTIGAAGPAAGELVRSGAARAEAAGLRLEVEPYASPAAAREAVADGELGSALVVTPQDGPRLLVGKDAPRTAVALLQGLLAERETRTILAREGVAAAVVQRALSADGPPLEVITPPRTDTSRGIAYLGALLLYLAILTYGFFIAVGIVTEKATRVVEVILSAVRPLELLAGKVGGLGLLSLAQFSLVAVAGLGTAFVAGVDLPTGAPLAIALIVLFSLLGYLLYACAFAVAGSVVSRQEDLQGSSAPLTVTLVAGFILTQTALNEPHGTLAEVLSIVPLTAPLAMPSRVALTDVPAWQIALAAALTLATALVVLRAAAGIYAATVLRTGQRVPLREALRLGRGPAA
jgi:ABC-2 type transport system permease protein